MDTKSFIEELQEALSGLDISLKFYWFLATNNKAIFYHGNIQHANQKTFPFKKVALHSHYPKKVIFTFILMN